MSEELCELARVHFAELLYEKIRRHMGVLDGSCLSLEPHAFCFRTLANT